ncbi:hypothetical protein [Bacillus sp. V59.32b]|uniref:hypothetical protein n=1 Tax=Bacillus sp. V59.32b TaxID=1758642 RepID=UPI000E3DC98E|nr:hypothetical protein [Bacillus sp. V59.32b]RFU61694.1 hypothetical protein D0463_14770 [Bacillus sp. V59.32b]
MFDPTAFENMKVVLEGAIYDKELDGKATVTNRKDLVNLSTLSRQYEIEISLPDHLTCRSSILLEATIENLASELLERESDSQSGSAVTVRFTWPCRMDEKEAVQLIGSLETIWGKERIIDVSSTVQYSKAGGSHASYTVASVSFGRLVKEEQMDDLLMMTDYMVDSLEMLESLNGEF